MALLLAQWPFCRAWISPLPAARTHIRWRLACVSRSWNEPCTVLWVTSPYVVSRGCAYLADLLACPHARQCANANSFMWLANHWQWWDMFKLTKGVCKCTGSRLDGYNRKAPACKQSCRPCTNTPVIAKANAFGKWFGHLLCLEVDSQTTHHISDLNSFLRTLMFSI